jgi:hypothetical protein
VEELGQIGGRINCGHDGSSALFRRCDGDALPPLDGPFASQRTGGHIGPRGDEWLNGSDAKHRSVANDLVQAIGLENRDGQPQRDLRLGRNSAPFHRSYDDAGAADAHDAGTELVASPVEHGNLCAGAEPHHLRQVTGLVGREHGVLVDSNDVRRKESREHIAIIAILARGNRRATAPRLGAWRAWPTLASDTANEGWCRMLLYSVVTLGAGRLSGAR